MFFNILFLVLIYSFFFIIIISAGKILNKYILKFNQLGLGELGIFGFLSIYYLVLILHFITPINEMLIYSIYSILIFTFIKNFKEIKINTEIKSYSLILIFIIFILLSITNNHHDDLYIFQLPIINYMQNLKIVFGLVNLNDFIGQGHSLYEVMSFFKIPFFENRAYFLLPILFLNFFVIYLFEVLKLEKNQFLKLFISFIFILLIIRFNRSKEFGTDLPVLCLLFYIQINLLRFLEKKNFDFFLKSILACLFAVVFKLYGALSIFYLIPFLILLKKNIFNIFKKKIFLTFVFLLFSLTLSKNLIVSGCLFYPIATTCLDKNLASWSVGKENSAKRYEFYKAQTYGWRSYTKNINNKNFISAKNYNNLDYFEKIKGVLSDKDLEKTLTGFFLVIIFLAMSFYSKNKIKKLTLKKIEKFLISLFVFIPFLIWFFKIPQSRYGFFAYYSFFIFIIFYFYFSLGEISKKISLSIFLIAIFYLGTKNIHRVKNEISNLENLTYEYPIKTFDNFDYSSLKFGNLFINFPNNSFMECGNIPMPCASNKNMVSSLKKIRGYYFLIGDSAGLSEHIDLSSIYDMIDTNN